MYTAYGFISNGVVDTGKVGLLLKLSGFGLNDEFSKINTGESIEKYLIRIQSILRTNIPEVRKAVVAIAGGAN